MSEVEKSGKKFPGLILFLQVACRIGFVLSLFFLLAHAGNPYVVGAILVLTLGVSIATMPADNER